MRVRKKVSLKLIEDARSRRTTYKKRKQGILKKIDELVKLSDVKACLIVYSDEYDSNPGAWPSREGVEEVVSKFMELSMDERTKKMLNHEAFINQRITKERHKLRSLCEENRDSRIRDLMFSCLNGEMDVSCFDESDIRDMVSFVNRYLSEVTRRIEILRKENGGESSSLPPPLVDVADQNQNQQEPFQFDYQALFDFYDQIPEKLHAFNMDMNLNPNMILDLNQDPCEQEGFGEDENIFSMDSSHHQFAIACICSTSHKSADDVDRI